MAYKQLLVFFLQAITMHPVVSGACPSSGYQALRQISACTRNLSEVMDFTKGKVSALTIENYCNTSATKEIRCVEKVVDDCRRTNPTTRRVVDKAVNVNGIRNNVKIICDNRHALVSAQSCLSRYQDKVRQCSSLRYVNHSYKLSILRMKGYSVKRLEEEVYKLLCEYQNEMKDCQKPYRFSCGKEVGKVFDDIIAAKTPPVCSSGGNSRSSVLPASLSTSTAYYTSPRYFRTSGGSSRVSVLSESLTTTTAYHTSSRYLGGYTNHTEVSSSRGLISNTMILLSIVVLSNLTAIHFNQHF